MTNLVKTIPSQKSFPVFNSDVKIKLVVTEKCNQQINLINKNIPKLEWSGILFYAVDGSILDPTNMTLTCHHVYPIDIGSKAHTGWSGIDTDVTSFMNDNFDSMLADGWTNQGLIHSHNDMSVFFSGEDMSELNDRVDDHNFYLSLIVNIFGEKCAKVVYVERDTFTDIKGTREIKNNDGIWVKTDAINRTETIERMVVHNCDIIIEGQVSNPITWLNDKVQKLLTAKQTQQVAQQNKNAKAVRNWTNPHQTDLFEPVEYPSYGSYVADEVAAFLSTAIALDNKCADEVEVCLERFNKELQTASLSKDFDKTCSEYVQNFNAIFDNLYSTYFGAMDDDAIVADVIQQCIDIIENHAADYDMAVGLVQEGLTTVGKSLTVNGKAPKFQTITIY